jgi:competence protein ComEA
VLTTTPRRADRETQVRERLAHLIRNARTTRTDDQDGSPPIPEAERAGSRWAGRLVERWLPGGIAVPRRRLPIALIAALGIGVAVVAGVALSSHGGQEMPPNLPVARASTDPAPATTRPGESGSIVVSVVGRVVRPGLITLRDGARVADALSAAGGPVPGVDVSGLNIARKVSDGEQIYVGVPAPPEAVPDPSTGVPGKIDLNTASLAQLDTLPGVGSVTAQRILDWRTQHGRFSRVEQLREIDGIGPAKFGKLKDLVVVR